LTGRWRQTRGEAEEEARRDERNAGCLADLGCHGLGCLTLAAVSPAFLIFFVAPHLLR
jgi:hypothetical protein